MVVFKNFGSLPTLLQIDGSINEMLFLSDLPFLKGISTAILVSASENTSSNETKMSFCKVKNKTILLFYLKN